MAYTDESRYKMGKLLNNLIIKLGPPKVKGGDIMYKVETGDKGVIETQYITRHNRKPIDFRRINVIFTPNGKYAYHKEVIRQLVNLNLHEACKLLDIGFEYREFKSLVKLFINLDGKIVPWNYTYNGEIPMLYITDENRKSILSCVGQSYGTMTFITTKQNILKMNLDYSETELREANDDNQVIMYLNLGYKNVTINGEKISFREMNESGLISVLKEEISTDEDIQMYCEGCGYQVLSGDIDFKSTEDVYVYISLYLASIDGVNVNKLDNDVETSINRIIDKIAEEKGW
jgi:hypothetical protein